VSRNPISLRRAAILAPALALALSLGGCVSLFPKAKPAQMYRFGATPAEAPGTALASPADAFGVLKAPTGFARAAAGDQILTVMPGGQSAYVAQARWVSAAVVLFDEALERAFDADTGRARLISRGEVGKAQLVLKLDVRTFEADYDDGPRAPPTVKVEVRTLLTRNLDRGLVSDQVFTATAKAGDNRVGAITQAFDKAAGQVIGQVIAAVNAAAPAAATAPAAIAQPTPAAPLPARPAAPIAPPAGTRPAEAGAK
jgi:cholesterol transport system auxiliary component